MGLNGAPDARVFTGRIGEVSAHIREAGCAGLDMPGVVVDATRNEAAADARAEVVVVPVSAVGNRVPSVVVQAEEERELSSRVVETLLGMNVPNPPGCGHSPHS